MKLLLDTHVVIWAVLDSKRLPTSVKAHIDKPFNQCYVSMASLWEMSIKHSLGRLEFETPLDEVYRIITDSGFELLPISPSHLLRNASLPFHHQDPFDRLIIAQAFVEHMTVVSKDRMFPTYGVRSVWK